jgi:hypothetical protein
MSLNLKWPGSASFDTGSMPTPFGLYDNDADFRNDAPRTAVWCAKRLGYPIIDIELVSDQFYACFEEATSEYSAQVNQFNIRNNLYLLHGQSKSNNRNFSQTLVEGSTVPLAFRMSQAYGTVSGVGGATDIKKAYINISASVQSYDLSTQAIDKATGLTMASLYSGSNAFDVTKVFYEAIPAITRFFDPYSVGAQGTLNLISELGFGNYSPAAQFLMMPLYEDVLRMQHIEFNDHIRKSAHSFNIVNNKIEVFPVPSSISPIKKIYFEYFVRNDFFQNSILIDSGSISDYSDAKYDFIQYSDINDVGKQWIRKYTLALAKELLGAIREKYNEIPIPDATISLDGAALRSEAQVEKDALVTQLRENLEELSRVKQLEYKKNESEFHQDMLKHIPLKLYVG